MSFFDVKIDSFSSICSEFIDKFKLLATLKAAGARKLRGTPIKRTFGFLLSSIFANGSSFNQQKYSVDGDGIPSYRGTNRFLSSESIDWGKRRGKHYRERYNIINVDERLLNTINRPKKLLTLRQR